MSKSISEFDPGQKAKQGGATEGFIKTISHGPDQGTYMFKPVPLSDADTENTIERSNVIAEYSFGNVFKTILGDQAPEIGLVKRDEDGAIFLTSKFLNGYSDISRFLQDSANIEKLSPNHGLEKVVMTSLLCGDMDLHGDNVGVIPIQNTKGAQEYIAVKIDHGAAGTLPEDENIEQSLKKHYLDRQYAQGLQDFDVSKTRQAISEILSACPKGETTRASQTLENVGVNHEFTDMWYSERSTRDLEKYLYTRVSKLVEFDQKLAIVEAMQHQNPKWKQSGAWIEALVGPDGKSQDPRKFAAENNITIIDQKPVQESHRSSLAFHNPELDQIKEIERTIARDREVVNYGSTRSSTPAFHNPVQDALTIARAKAQMEKANMHVAPDRSQSKQSGNISPSLTPSKPKGNDTQIDK